MPIETTFSASPSKPRLGDLWSRLPAPPLWSVLDHATGFPELLPVLVLRYDGQSAQRKALLVGGANRGPHHPVVWRREISLAGLLAFEPRQDSERALQSPYVLPAHQ